MNDRSIDLGANSFDRSNMRNKGIKIISQFESMKEANQKQSYWLVIGIVVFTLFCLGWGISSLSEGNIFDTYMALNGVLLFGIGGWYLFKRDNEGGTEYVPYKSFKSWRVDSREAAQNKYRKVLIFVAIWVVATLIIAFSSGESLEALKIAAWTLLSIPGVLYYKKSLEFHEDVDYTAKQNLTDLIGCSVNERICASYQSFGLDDTVHEKDCIFLVTNLKVFLSYYKDKKWHFISQPLSAITEMGLATTSGGSSQYTHIILHFSDNTAVSILLEPDKVTTNSELFVSKFLTILDDHLSGKTMSSNSQRRRVVTSGSTNPNTNTSDNTVTVRAIELSDSIIEQIKNGIEEPSGRSIEL